MCSKKVVERTKFKFSLTSWIVQHIYKNWKTKLNLFYYKGTDKLAYCSSVNAAVYSKAKASIIIKNGFVIKNIFKKFCILKRVAHEI